MSDLPMRQRARLAAGHAPAKHAKGGMVVPGGQGLKARQLVERAPSAPRVRQPQVRVNTPRSPIVRAKMRNKVPG